MHISPYKLARPSARMGVYRIAGPGSVAAVCCCRRMTLNRQDRHAGSEAGHLHGLRRIHAIRAGTRRKFAGRLSAS